MEAEVVLYRRGLPGKREETRDPEGKEVISDVGEGMGYLGFSVAPRT